MRNQSRTWRLAIYGVVQAVMLASFVAGTPAHAQGGIISRLGNLFTPGGYLFATDSGRDAFGNTQFYRDTDLFALGLGVGTSRVSGGIQYIETSDHFFPLSGDNRFSLIGPSFRLTAPRTVGGLQPYVSAGVFAGNVKSSRLGVDEWEVVPSAAAGFDYVFGGLLTLRTQYRICNNIAGVNPDGLAVSLRIFH